MRIKDLKVGHFYYYNTTVYQTFCRYCGPYENRYLFYFYDDQEELTLLATSVKYDLYVPHPNDLNKFLAKEL